MGALLPGSRRSSRAGLICIVPAAVVAAGTVLLLLHGEAVSEFVRAVSPGCLFRRWFGVSCPGCGGTRAFCALAKGDFAGVLRCNFWWLPTAVVLFAEYGNWAAERLFPERNFPRWKKFRGRLLVAYAVFTVAYAVAKNIWCF